MTPSPEPDEGEGVAETDGDAEADGDADREADAEGDADALDEGVGLIELDGSAEASVDEVADDAGATGSDPACVAAASGVADCDDSSLSDSVRGRSAESSSGVGSGSAGADDATGGAPVEDDADAFADAVSDATLEGSGEDEAVGSTSTIDDSTHRCGIPGTVDSAADAGCAVRTRDARIAEVVAIATTPETRCVDMSCPSSDTEKPP